MKNARVRDSGGGGELGEASAISVELTVLYLGQKNTGPRLWGRTCSAPLTDCHSLLLLQIKSSFAHQAYFGNTDL
jgi:hypothetical protein